MRGLVPVLVFSGLAIAGAASAETRVMSLIYTCERGVRVPVTFLNQGEGRDIAVMMFEGKLIPMRLAPSGSGVRYVALDEQDGYRLWTKGADAMVGYLAADHTASEQVLLKECRSGE